MKISNKNKLRFMNLISKQNKTFIKSSQIYITAVKVSLIKFLVQKKIGLKTIGLLLGTTTFASIGIAGVPGTASIAATVVLSTLGLPIEGLAMLLGIDVIIDMVRTATNVTGAAVTALLVANSEGEFDRTSFEDNSKDELELNIV